MPAIASILYNDQYLYVNEQKRRHEAHILYPVGHGVHKGLRGATR
jgi:hypothetical protein